MNSYFFNINKIQNQVIKYMPKKYQGEPYNRITAKELYALSKTEEISIIDVREMSNSDRLLPSSRVEHSTSIKKGEQKIGNTKK